MMMVILVYALLKVYSGFKFLNYKYNNYNYNYNNNYKYNNYNYNYNNNYKYELKEVLSIFIKASSDSSLSS
jgi:hypothetical protein